jgi:hypothetical protein
MYDHRLSGLWLPIAMSPSSGSAPLDLLRHAAGGQAGMAPHRRQRGGEHHHTGCSLSSAERIGDLDAAIVLAVAEIFGQDVRAAHRAGCLDDRGVPV